MKVLNFDNIELKVSLDCKVGFVGLRREHIVIIMTCKIVLLIGIEILLLACLCHQVIRILTLLISEIESLVGLDEVLDQTFGRILYIFIDQVIFDISNFYSLLPLILDVRRAYFHHYVFLIIIIDMIKPLNLFVIIFYVIYLQVSV